MAKQYRSTFLILHDTLNAISENERPETILSYVSRATNLSSNKSKAILESLQQINCVESSKNDLTIYKLTQKGFDCLKWMKNVIELADKYGVTLS